MPHAPVYAWLVPRPHTRVRRAACALSVAAAAIVALAGCAKFDAAMGQQWIDVTFSSTTTVSAARHIADACSQITNVHVQAVTADPAHTGFIESVRYNTSQASDAQMARLQVCLQKFPAVQGVTLNDSGEGD
jgi:hypothetical protein